MWYCLAIASTQVGAGAFGEVFKGMCMNEPVAIKTMIEVNEANVKAFRAEILLTSALRHPNIVNFVGACWSQELVCLVLEWATKGSLADLLRTPSLRWDEPLLKLAQDAARGMVYLHGREFMDEETGKLKRCILHRDIKPDNALITEFTNCKLTDFGTSRARDLDVTMSSVGTPLFAAPEIMRGDPYDEKVDVYSFGLLLLDIATEDSLLDFIGEMWRVARDKKKAPKDPMRFIRSMVEEDWRPVTTDAPIGRGAPGTISALIVRCCAKESKERPSFEEVLSELLGVCAAEIEQSVFARVSLAVKDEPEKQKVTRASLAAKKIRKRVSRLSTSNGPAPEGGLEHEGPPANASLPPSRSHESSAESNGNPDSAFELAPSDFTRGVVGLVDAPNPTVGSTI